MRPIALLFSLFLARFRFVRNLPPYHVLVELGYILPVYIDIINYKIVGALKISIFLLSNFKPVWEI